MKTHRVVAARLYPAFTIEVRQVPLPVDHDCPLFEFQVGYGHYPKVSNLMPYMVDYLNLQKEFNINYHTSSMTSAMQWYRVLEILESCANLDPAGRE